MKFDQPGGYIWRLRDNWAYKTLKNAAAIGLVRGLGEIYTGIKIPTNPAENLLSLIVNEVIAHHQND